MCNVKSSFKLLPEKKFIYSGVYDNKMSISHDLDPESCFKINLLKFCFKNQNRMAHNIFEWFEKFHHFHLFI